MQSSTIQNCLFALAVGAIGVLVFESRVPSFGDTPDIPSHEEDAVLLDTHPGAPARSLSDSTQPPPLTSLRRARPDRPQSLATFEERMRSEPKSASWAAYNEMQIKSAITDDVLLASSIEPPVTSSVECRSTLCRVNLLTTGDESSDGLTFQLLSSISDTLNNAQIFSSTQPDGAVSLTLYATYRKPPGRAAESLRNGRN